MKKPSLLNIVLLSISVTFASASYAANNNELKQLSIKTVHNEFAKQWKASNYQGAYSSLLQASKDMSHMQSDEQAKILNLLAITCQKIECEYEKNKAYLDELIALKGLVEQQKVDKAYQMAHAMSLSANKYEDAEKYFADMQANSVNIKEQTYFLQGVAKAKQKQYDQAIELLEPLIAQIELEGRTPKESWLKLLGHAYFATKQYKELVGLYNGIASYYQSNKNQQLLQKFSLMLDAQTDA
jgi:hypothetical protein